MQNTHYYLREAEVQGEHAFPGKPTLPDIFKKEKMGD